MTARNTKPLTPTQCADKIAKRNETRTARIMGAVKVATEAATRAVIDTDKRADERDMALVPEAQRPLVAKVLLALGHEACGLEVEAGNDVGSPPMARGQTEAMAGQPKGTTPYVPGPAARAAERGAR